MNIHAVGSGSLIRRAGQAAGAVDLTVSDLGVARTRTERRPDRTGRGQGVQVTSTRRLQELLSPEETRALRETFSALSAPEAGAARGTGRYGVQGTSKEDRSALEVGRLVDLTG